MKKLFTKTLTALALSVALSGTMTTSATAAGLMTPIGSQHSLEIQSHHVDVSIDNGYAITTVEQTFSNPQTTDLEATYSFPVPENGTVAEFTVWIDGKPVTAEVMEKEKAKKVYEEEKAAGRDTGLASKNKHYNFDIKVSPVRAGQTTRVRFVYMQATDTDTGIGRYVYPLEDGGTDVAAENFWQANDKVSGDFSFTMSLRSGYPVDDVRIPGQPNALIQQLNQDEWTVSLGNAQPASLKTIVAEEGSTAQSTSGIGVNGSSGYKLNQDIVTYWRHTPGLPGSIDLVTHKEPGETTGTFMMTLTPGDDLADITEGRDWMFVLDTSGSMSGKYQKMVDGVQAALGKLNNKDRFRIVLFNSGAQELTNGWVSVTEKSSRKWSDKLANAGFGGGTDLYAGALQGLKKLDADRTSSLILVTDGEANLGVTEKEKFLDLMKKYDVRLFTAVMGNGANRPLLNAMTEVSNGFAVSVSNADDIVGKLMEFTSKATHEALHDVKFDIKGIKTFDLTPEVTSTLYRGEQLVVFGHYKGTGPATVTLDGKVSGQKKSYTSTFNFPDNRTDSPEIERLWAYAKIQNLQEQADYLGEDKSENAEAITSIAVQHGLVTDQTSMVVMTEEQFKQRGIERLNRDRREKEKQAQQIRNSAPVQNNRVDSQQPAFSSSRASHGGGAFGWGLLLTLPMLLIARMRRVFGQQ